MEHQSKRRVLCVDDHKDTCELITDLLHEYEVVPAHTKIEGVLLASKGNFDLIVLDYVLPDGTGLELCEEIRAFDLITPILFFTGTAETTFAQVIAAGGQAMIRKTDIGELLPRIAAALEVHTFQRFPITT